MRNKSSNVQQRNRLPGHVRRTEILDAALKVLASEGYPKFTLRNVASAAKIHFATLQYHFKSKNELLSALIRWKLQEDQRQLQQTVEMADGSPKKKFCAGIKLIMEADRQPQVIGFFLQLWALANHDPMAGKLTDEFYRAYRSWMVDLVAIANPRLSRAEKEGRALPIMAMLEGILPTFTISKKNRRARPELDQDVAEIAWTIATRP